MKKELILITSYCNTKEKRETLFSFLKSLQPFRDSYDIMLTSHLSLDSFVYDYIDHFYYNSKNDLLTSLEYLQNGWFRPLDNYVIWSSFMNYANTHLAIWNMLIPCISIAKSLGYEKIHNFEYDTKIESTKELEENSELLNNYDYVIYGAQDTHKKYGAFESFRVDGIIEEWKEIESTSLEKFYKGMYPKVPENITYKLITEQRTYYIKDYYQLSNNGIFLNLNKGQKIYWDTPFFDPSDEKIKFLYYNLNSEQYNIKIIINNTEYFYLPELPEHNWRIIDIAENIQDVKNISVFRNNLEVINLDLSSEESKKSFIKYNSVLTDESIDPSIQI